MISYETIGRVIDRLTTDAHNETGSVREYARSLLVDLGVPVPADPEAPRVATQHWDPVRGSSYGKSHMSQSMPDPFDAAPIELDLSEFGRRPFESAYHSRCRVQDDYIDEGELIIKTPDGYAHLNCARDEYPNELAEIERRDQ
jgi:hypothetical protein